MPETPDRNKWDVIRERKLRQKAEAAIRAGGGIDRSWQRFTFCRICGKKICVNNYPDHKVRLPKLRGVIVCPWCRGHGGEFVVRMYRLLQKMTADMDRELSVNDAEAWIIKAAKVLQHSPEIRRKRAQQQG